MNKMVIAAFLSACMLFEVQAKAQHDDSIIKVRAEADAPGTAAGAREDAIAAAKTNILRDVLATALSPDAVTLLSRPLETPDQYIRSTQLLRIEPRDAGTHVEVECYVKRDLLLRDAAKVLLPQLTPVPSALVLIAEQHDATAALDVTMAGMAETLVADTLKKSRFQIADSGLARRVYAASPDELLARVTGDDTAAAELARQAFGDVTIVGDTQVTVETKNALFSSHARLRVRIFQSDGKRVDELAAEATVHSADSKEGYAAALEDAAAKIAPELFVAATVAAVAGSATAGVDGLMISIENSGTRERFDEVLAVLRERVGQEGVRELFFCEDLARLRVASAAPLNQLVDMLTRHAYTSGALETHYAAGQMLRLRFVP